jgi:site-specific recombinase XerC
MRLADALTRFLTQLQADGRSPHTVAQYRRHVHRFASWLEAEAITDDVAALEPERGQASGLGEALRRPDGQAMRTGSFNAPPSSLSSLSVPRSARGSSSVHGPSQKRREPRSADSSAVTRRLQATRVR